jgi:cytidylate kinase
VRGVASPKGAAARGRRAGSRGAGRRPVITIDGPAGAGKSTVAAELALRLGYRLIDTGALYRAVAWRVGEAGVDPADEAGLRALLAATRVELEGEAVRVNGRDVRGEIRTPEVGELASRLSQLGVVRDKVTPIQRRLAARGGAVLEGRDTGSVVCPEAEVKFYLDASPEVRAARRRRELAARGLAADPAAVAEEIRRRDRQDRERALAPLVVPPGATVIDSSGRSVEDVVRLMLEEVARRGCSTGS